MEPEEVRAEPRPTMEPEEDSFVNLPYPSGPTTGSLSLSPEHVWQEVERCRELCSALEQAHVELQTGAVEERSPELRKQREHLHEHPKQQMCLNREAEIYLHDSVLLAREMKNILMQKHQMLKKALEDKRKRVFWKDPEMMLLPTLPEKKMAFKGLVTNKDENKLMLTPLVHYPLRGGSALITFEKAEGKSEKSPTIAECCGYLTLEPALLPFAKPGFGVLSPLPALWGFCPLPTVLPHIPAYGMLGIGINPLCRGLSLLAVAQRIIEAKEHMVELTCGEELEELSQCRMQVQAAPVDLLLPSALEIRLTRSSRSIILSDLPSLDIPEEALLDKLEIFFSKRKNGGGEVESTELLDNSGQVVLTFVEDRVAKLLIERGRIQVPLRKQTHELKISPCMSGDVSNLQLQPSRCPRTVLLSGIPDVLSEESMRDILEIHFQKPSRGGGEVDSVGYVPAGRHGVAVFTEDAG